MALYEWNKAFLAAERCEQRLVAQNTCQGRCVLAKQLSPQLEEAPQPYWKPSFVEFYYLFSLYPQMKARPEAVAVPTFRQSPLGCSQFEPEPPFVPPRV